MFKENELSLFSKIATGGFVLLLGYSAVNNIVQADAPSPEFFIIAAFGLMLFLLAKISIFYKGILISFGTSKMSPLMANLYRLGYWFMLVGVICTFMG